MVMRAKALSLVSKLSAISIAAIVMASAVAKAQNLEVKGYNPSEWTKGRFTEVVTVNGPGKTIYLAGIGAEDEKAPAGLYNTREEVDGLAQALIKAQGFFA